MSCGADAKSLQQSSESTPLRRHVPVDWLPVPFHTPGHAHFTGICGSGMKALAEVMLDAGWNLSGSDIDPQAIAEAEGLRKLGVDLHAGHQSAWIRPETQLLIYSSAVPPLNPERLRGAELGITQLSYTAALGLLSQARDSIVVTGTHGKTTTTAWLAHILREARLDPSAIIGGELCETETRNGWLGRGDHLIVEGCEYRRHFHQLHPRRAAILGIEPDHFDYFQSLEDTQAAFQEFAQRIPSGGQLLVHTSCGSTLAPEISRGIELQSFGFESSADWSASDLSRERGWTSFSLNYRGQHFLRGSICPPGRHNVLNAVAAGVLSYWSGASPHEIVRAWKTFPGVRRRFEIVRKHDGVTWVSDYAHHPTALRATLNTAREEWPQGRIWALFQPHQVSRTEALMDDYASALCLADRPVVFPVYGAREHDEQKCLAASQILAEKITNLGGLGRFQESLDQFLPTLEDELRPGDIVLLIGAGDINRIHHACT